MDDFTFGIWQQRTFQKDCIGEKDRRYFREIKPGDRLLTGEVQGQPGAGSQSQPCLSCPGSPGPWAGVGAAGQGHTGPLTPSGAASVTHPAFEGLHLQMLTPVEKPTKNKLQFYDLSSSLGSPSATRTLAEIKLFSVCFFFSKTIARQLSSVPD